MRHIDCRLLPTAELNALAVKAKSDTAAAQRLVEAVWPLLRVFSKPMASKGWDVDDLASEGVLAVYKAIRTYNPAKGAFTTYLRWAVVTRHFVHKKAMNRHLSIPKSPSKASKLALKSLSERKFASVEHIPDCLHPQDRSRDYWHTEAQRDAVVEAVDTMPGRGGAILRARINGLTLARAGQKLGVSKERARQIESVAIQALRKRLAVDS